MKTPLSVIKSAEFKAMKLVKAPQQNIKQTRFIKADQCLPGSQSNSIIFFSAKISIKK